MSRHATCPQCGTPFTLGEARIGKSIRCSKCGAVLRVSAKRSKDKADQEERPENDLAFDRETTPHHDKYGTGSRTERSSGGVPVGVLIAAVAGALLLGIGVAGGIAISYLKPAAPRESVDEQSTRQAAADSPAAPKQSEPEPQRPGAEQKIAALQPPANDRPPEPLIRDVWLYKTSKHEGWFERVHGREWIESTSDGGETRFEEVMQTPEYVELFDRSRAMQLKLFADHVVCRQGDNHVWSRLYAGYWVSAVNAAHMDEIATLRARIKELKAGMREANPPLPPPSSPPPNQTDQGNQGNLQPPLRLSEHLSVELGHGVKMEFARIRPGEFLMGSPDSDKDANDYEKPQHRVKITTDFYIGKYLVTQEQYVAVMGQNPSRYRFGGGGIGPGVDTRHFPVETVTWEGAADFCAELTRRDKQGRVFCLPTEAEWEYAARAGTSTRFFFGDETTDLRRHAWYRENSERGPRIVGTMKPNPWGLYDMHGNLWQWCADRLGQYYADAGKIDPKGPESGSGHVVRGGSWNDGPLALRAAFRHVVVHYGRFEGERRLEGQPAYRDHNIGFRVAVRLDMRNVLKSGN